MISNKNKKIFILLNISHSCNMGCKYCYYRNEMNEKPGIMGTEILNVIMQKAAESNFEEFEFISHGGEPLTRDNSFFHKLIAIQKKYLNDRICSNSIQTNGTLLTKDSIQMLKEYNYKVSISLDGPQIIHDNYRTYKNNKGTYDDIIRNIDFLVESGIEYGLLSVCNNETHIHMDEYYLLLKSLKNLKGLDIMEEQTSEALPSLLQGNFSKMIISLFDKWFYDVDCFFDVRFLSSIVSSILFSKPLTCSLMENCFQNCTMVSISPEGDISPCDSNPNINLGNIKNNSLEDLIFQNLTRKIYSKKEQQRLEKCLFCEWYKFCKGGCPSLTSNEGINIYCEDYKNIFSYISNSLKKLGITRGGSLDCNSLNNIPNQILKEKMSAIYYNIHNVC